jgi:hypothetical protein
MRREGQRTEQADDCPVAYIQSSGVSAEGRHHQALAIRSETAARNTAAAPCNARHWMQMAGDLAVDLSRRRLMTESERAPRQFAGGTAADSVRRIGIVVAG